MKIFFFFVLCHHIPCPIQQLLNVFSSCSYHFWYAYRNHSCHPSCSCQIQVHNGFGFPYRIPVKIGSALSPSWPDPVSACCGFGGGVGHERESCWVGFCLWVGAFFVGLSVWLGFCLLGFGVCFLVSEFCLEFFMHPCRPHDAFGWLTTWEDGLFSSTKEVIFEYQWVFDSSESYHITLWKSSLKRSKSALLKSRVMIMLCFPCSFFTGFWTPSCHHYCRQDFPDLHIPHQFFLVCKYGIQQSTSSHRVKKFSSIHSRNLLDCLWSVVPSADVGMAHVVHMNTRACQQEAVSSCLKVASSSNSSWKRCL